MARLLKNEDIKVWRHDELGGVEFRKGTAVFEPYPKHWHEEYQLCLITGGGGELVYRGARHDTPPASLFIVHPGEIHSNSTDTGCSFRSVYIDPKLIGKALGIEARELPFYGNAPIFDKEVVERFLSMHRCGETQGVTLEYEAAILSFLEALTRVAKIPPNNAEPRSEPHAVRIIQEYIYANFDRSISLNELTGVAGLSAYHLSRVFSQAVGVPPHAFQTQMRIAVAKRLIRRGYSVADTAVRVGFADQSHFHRHFRRLMKITPGEYLRNSKNVQD